MNQIKQQKIKLNEDGRNSRNDKNKNDASNNILSVIDKIFQLFVYKIFSCEQPDELNLPKWIKVSKQKIDVKKRKVQNEKKKKKKKKKLQERPSHKNLVTSSESNELLQDMEHGKITYEAALKKITNIRNVIIMFLKLNFLKKNQT